MTIYFPTLPETGGANLAALFAADPGRRAVFNNIVTRLDPDGSLGDRARYYVARHSFRRATLRSVLSATSQPIPEWARESSAAEKKNAAFIAAYRDTYNAVRRAERHERREAAHLG